MAGLSERLGALAGAACLAGCAVVVLEAAADQAALSPKPPPTALELRAARPRAAAAWASVHAGLAERFASDRPLELGEVWATRDARICGFANKREAAVDDIVAFWGADGRIRLRDEDGRAFVRLWTECLNDRFLELHAGAETLGECGSAHFRRTPLGRALCAVRP